MSTHSCAYEAEANKPAVTITYIIWIGTHQSSYIFSITQFIFICILTLSKCLSAVRCAELTVCVHIVLERVSILRMCDSDSTCGAMTKRDKVLSGTILTMFWGVCPRRYSLLFPRHKSVSKFCFQLKVCKVGSLSCSKSWLSHNPPQKERQETRDTLLNKNMRVTGLEPEQR